LIYREIYKLTPNAIHITFFDNFYDNNVLKFEDIFLYYKGNVNHLDKNGNELLYNKMLKILKSKTKNE
jgi:hypothetical protein